MRLSLWPMKSLTLFLCLAMMLTVSAQEKQEAPAGLRQLLGQVDRERKEILQIFEEYKKAVRKRDLNAIMEFYDKNVIAYDISPPLAYQGRDDYRKAWKAFLDQYEGPIEVEIKDPSLSWSGGLAFTYSLQHFSGKLKSGEMSDIWLRVTDCYSKGTDGKWKIVHEHVSVPTDFASGKSVLNLKP
jgi:ketosteroid isomerase-like protein